MDMDSLCRLCLATDANGVNLFKGRHSQAYLKQLKEVFRIELSDTPGWPFTACGICVEKLNATTVFRATMTASQKELLQLIPAAIVKSASGEESSNVTWSTIEEDPIRIKSEPVAEEETEAENLEDSEMILEEFIKEDHDEVFEPPEFQKLTNLLNELMDKTKSTERMVRVLYEDQMGIKGNEPVRISDHFPISTTDKWKEINELILNDSNFTERLKRYVRKNSTSLTEKTTRIKRCITTDMLLSANWSGMKEKRALKQDPFILCIYESWRTNEYTFDEFERMMKDVMKKLINSRNMQRCRNKKKMTQN